MSQLSRRAADVVDAIIEFPVVTSYTRIGSAVRRRLDGWRDVATLDMHGRVVVLTGATSGIGLAAANALTDAGATLVLVGRDAAKTERVRAELAARPGAGEVSVALADMGDLAAVRALAADLRDRHTHIDVLIHNAGALSAKRTIGPDGIEATVASQVVGPFLLTDLLLDRLDDNECIGRVITMSSGGMYSQPLVVGSLQMDEQTYKGATQYARAKRAQVTLNEMWANRTAGSDVRFHALHPGWADTPGVQDSLPTFRTIVGPLLRTPADGADTLVWLAGDDGEPLATNGGFWLDRRRRSLHILPTTRRSDTPDRRARLWDWVATAAGVSANGRA